MSIAGVGTDLTPSYIPEYHLAVYTFYYQMLLLIGIILLCEVKSHCISGLPESSLSVQNHEFCLNGSQYGTVAGYWTLLLVVLI